MATGNTLAVLGPFDNEPPSANYATLDIRNGHPVLDFDQTTSESAIFTIVMPDTYTSGGTSNFVHFSVTSAITNSVGWDISYERIGDAVLDIDADSFAAAVTAVASAPGTSGLVKVLRIDVSGASMDGVGKGEACRVRVRRNFPASNTTEDAELVILEIRET
jgi:hypothetical protein